MIDGTDERGRATPARVPEITAEVRDDGTGEISVDGVVERVQLATLAEAGAAITARVAELAGETGRPLPVKVRDPDGVWSLLIHPDGVVDEAPDEDADGTPGEVTATGAAATAAVTDPAPSPVATPPTTPAPTPPLTAAATTAAPPTAAAAPSAPTPTPTASPTASSPASAAAVRTRGGDKARETAPLPTLDDLLAARHPVSGGPAEHGWRAGVRRVTFGAIAPGPGRVEQRRRVASASVRRTLDGPKTVVVINPKGGAHKTTATMLLAATFGLQRGGYTLAWDNNETRGTLGWRSSHTDHTNTAVDLLSALPRLSARGTVRIGDLDQYVRTQPTEQFDVLASDESSASISSVDAASFRSLHTVLSQFYRVLVIDTGNNMRASNWQAAVALADQIVVVSTIREDTAQSAAWALDSLRASGREEAVRKAVTVLSAPEPKVDKDLRGRLRSHFGALTRAVIEVPHDRSLVSGGPIDYDTLHPRTRDAWLKVTAVVAEGL
ncbi:MinD/ParA family ATP-binding protein [Cellulomonas sp. URHB0016]